MLTKEAKKARAKYQREWARANPEKVKEYTRRYWIKKAREQADKGKHEEVSNARHL